MTNNEKLELIKQLIQHKRKIDIFIDQFAALFGGVPGNGRCKYSAFIKLFENYMHLVADAIGETKQGIEWFVWENNCGDNKMEACSSEDDDPIAIDSAETYLEFLNKLNRELND